ncbi:MAG: 3-isopropylmalate dehydratase small subunit [Candidatus Nitrosopumilus limneticus]|nr:3-isopropylmalate dehydratase subunit LeuD [Candidatus Nitrosopumilus limneticus]HJJ20740.1 3-isopropylmalate dehydratase small subunit [Nitrosopumilus sp.]MDC4211688.1 3-isopropylmalate dehydratase small subunit [Candidatus Nitrosopumilus limneticus]MDC4213005.1 3-isopropylmalate dehydratase small subunit [Candidatus Nitrosopumilus limneticus]MDC4214604.1 3-isopropylmalate dehydratase small subunit [Candidatus Nitrosopumilus limneticus]
MLENWISISMKPFQNVKSIVTPLDRVNVDTDQIIPKQFLKLVQKSGFGKFLFFNWRYDENENVKSDFILNDSKYNGSKILVTGDNFGCGSSREHAVWALDDYGFSVIISSSFADIFFSNCFKNGILPISLELKMVERLLHETNPIEIDLQNQLIKTTSENIPFEINSHKKKILLDGLDDIEQTFQYEDKISEFEEKSTVPSVL